MTSGIGNVAVGYATLAAEDDGDKSTAVGYSALTAQTGTTGTVANTAVGFEAGKNITTGTENTIVGAFSSASAVGGVNQTVIGSGITGNADNSVVLGNTSVTKVYCSKGADAKVYLGNIEFTSDDASGNVNTLDDYEEGTFTPVWVSASGTLGTINYTNQVGKYTKIGNAVTVTISFYNGSFAVGTGSGTLKVTGLPFTAGAKSSLALGDTRLFGGDNPTEAEVDNGAVTVTLYYRDAADGANTALQTADAATGTGAFNLITLSGTYFV